MVVDKSYHDTELDIDLDDLLTEDLEEYQESERAARYQMEQYRQHNEQW